MRRPRIAMTMGDVAGIGPEIIARVCADRPLRESCRPLVIGHPRILERALKLVGADLSVTPAAGPGDLDDADAPAHRSDSVPCWNPTDDAAAEVPSGRIDARAGEAAFTYLVAATQAALDGSIDAIATAPLNKAALYESGHRYPGHTEILAEVCEAREFAMMLHLPQGGVVGSPHGLSVAHVTLHTSIQSVPELLSPSGVTETARLLDAFLKGIGCRSPRIGVCALNPHAGERGLFGTEEQTVIAPAVSAVQSDGIRAVGPIPADTLFQRAVAGEFDGVVAMYHDQGHIAIKLIGFERAVNITLGLPIVRTSPSHGTAFDIAWQGQARPDGMREAVRIAALLAEHRQTVPTGNRLNSGR